MPRIFDNIELDLLPALRATLEVADRSDFCVGHFNLRGWKAIDDLVEQWPGGPGKQCRLLVGMQRLPQDELRAAFSLTQGDEQLDNQTALRLKKRLAEEFRNQLTFGVPTNADETGLRRLAAQLKAGKLVVKLFLRHALHAKLYLLFRTDPINPIVGYLGSSNLTLAGLSHQGELNVDLLDYDAANKLVRWFEDRWNDRWCVDITAELVQVIDESWARDEVLSPYQIYVKMAYHLAQEARAGLSEFRIPPEFGNRLFYYQVAAVKIAAHHLNKRGGVLIGDVVGLGKTLMASALAKIFQDDHFTETLIICPKNLVKMWEDYVTEYRLLAKVLSVTRAARELPELRRYRVVLIDESHNLRNREGKRYRAIQEYIQENESKCILLSATPYNKTYLDLSSQLRLFVPEDKDLGIRPERLLRELGETEFIRQFVQDVIENSEGPELLRAFWHAIEKVTILDPTCGSGAFLFAALNILEPLYEACLDRMEAFVEDLDRSGEKHRPEKFSDFRKVLDHVAAHPNRRYFIFKSIILNNLFGVDIMEEAVEICKLRLFLKLAAQVEPDAARDNLGIEPSKKDTYAKWLKSHQPFHWFVEFYGIVSGGGFDVIIGNPPYLEHREIEYDLKGYACLESGAVHAMCIERSAHLLHEHGCMSMIVPLALPSTQRMKIVQDILEKTRSAWYANFAWRPAKLFDTVNRALTIFVVTPSGREQTFSTNYQKWTSDDREGLFDRLGYVEVLRQRPAFWVPKLGDTVERAILDKCLTVRTATSHFTGRTEHRVYYRTDGGLYWKVFTDHAPAFKLNGKAGHSSRETWFTAAKREQVGPIIAALSSDVFWWWYTVTSNVRHLNPCDVQNYPMPGSALADEELRELGQRYLKDIDRNSTMLVREQKQTGRTETQSFKIQKSKLILDEIDTALARHYGFTEEELDFLINYDIKYRMGRDAGDEGE